MMIRRFLIPFLAFASACAAYVPKIILSHAHAPLPLHHATETERVVLALPSGVLPLLPHGARMAVVTSWDDGHPNDLRLARLLREHGYAGTFFLNEFSHARKHAIPDLLALGMEIGAHTVNHPRGWEIPPEAWLTECLQNRLGLELDTRHPVVSFAYPYNHVPAHDAEGDYVLRGVRSAGFLSGRTTRTGGHTITDYTEPLSFATDGHFRMALERHEAAWDRAAARPGGVYYIWGHSSELRTPEDWDALDALLVRRAAQPGVWYATQGELFLWRWLRENASVAAAASPGEYTVEFPRLHPHWRARLPLSPASPAS